MSHPKIFIFFPTENERVPAESDSVFVLFLFVLLDPEQG